MSHDNLDASLSMRIHRDLEARLHRAAEDRMIKPSTLARQILAHRLGLSRYDPLADGHEAEPWAQR